MTNLQSPNHEQAPTSTGNLDFGQENAFGFLPSQLSHMSNTHSLHSSSPAFPGSSSPKTHKFTYMHQREQDLLDQTLMTVMVI